MIKYFCNWCGNETTKKYSNVHLVVDECSREIARQYHVCPKCTEQLRKLIRKDDMRK